MSDIQGLKKQISKLVSQLAYLQYQPRLLFAGNLIRKPYFQELEYRVAGDLTNTETTTNNNLWLGINPGLNENQIDYLAEKLEEFFVTYFRF